MVLEEERIYIMQAEQLGNPVDYNRWLDDYICMQGIDITSSAYQGVVNGEWYDISVGQVLDKSRNVKTWQKVFQRRLCRIKDDTEMYLFLREYTEKALEVGYQF